MLKIVISKPNSKHNAFFIYLVCNLNMYLLSNDLKGVFFLFNFFFIFNLSNSFTEADLCSNIYAWLDCLMQHLLQKKIGQEMYLV